MTMKRLSVIFSGMVQGVGFRFACERTARRFSLAGYVRNLPSGKVELVAEGEETVLKDFLKGVCESSMQSYIRDVETHWSGAEGNFKQFSIRA